MMFKILKNKVKKFLLSLKQTGNVVKDAAIYWGLSKDNNDVKDMSHWRGVGRWDDKKWFNLGDFHLSLIGDLFNEFDPEYKKSLNRKSAIEWGPGGGANMRVLCDNFSLAYGIDISEYNLAECSKQMESFSFNNFKPLSFNPDNPESIETTIADDSIDFVLSTAVFQHFPSQQYADRILALMNKIMKSDSFGLIQVRYDDSNKYKKHGRNYFENVLIMTIFHKEEFAKMLHDNGFNCLKRLKDIDSDKANYEYYFFKKEKLV